MNRLAFAVSPQPLRVRLYVSRLAVSRRTFQIQKGQGTIGTGEGSRGPGHESHASTFSEISPIRNPTPHTLLLVSQLVTLKYCNATMRCDEVIDGEGGANAPPLELRCTFEELSAEGSAEAGGGEGVAKRPKPKGNISWVSAEEAVRAEVRLYSHLFDVDSPDEKWEEQVRCEVVSLSTTTKMLTQAGLEYPPQY